MPQATTPGRVGVSTAVASQPIFQTATTPVRAQSSAGAGSTFTTAVTAQPPQFTPAAPASSSFPQAASFPSQTPSAPATAGARQETTAPAFETAQATDLVNIVAPNGIASVPWWAWALGGAALIGGAVVVKKLVF